MLSTRDKTLEEGGARQFLVGVEGLRIELTGIGFDRIRRDRDRPRLINLPDCEVLQVEVGRCLSFGADAVRRSVGHRSTSERSLGNALAEGDIRATDVVEGDEHVV
jgi:hypothetical protein